AGVGKTSLLRRFRAQRAEQEVRWGACERLFTPRALGPFLDIAQVGEGQTGHAFAAALLARLRGSGPVAVVLEDLHWADEGSLDGLRFLGNRIEQAPALLLASFRDDELSPSNPLQVVLGELASSAERLHLEPLSLEAVRRLAAASGADAEELFRTTGGNPF